MKDVVILGAGGFGREVHQLIDDVNEDAPTWNFLGFLDGNPARRGEEVHGAPVLGGLEWAAAHPAVAVAVGVGGTAARRKLVEQLVLAGCRDFPCLVHPTARVGRNVALGTGATVCAGNILTTDIRLGSHVILNLDCTVGHDAVLGDWVTVAPSANLSGAVEVGEGCDLGTNCTLIQGVRVGHWTVVGAGAVVVRDLPANVTAVGSPARPIKERPEGWQLD